jgi:SecD/SecF fusion protein
MQNKKTIKIVILVLSLICLYEMSFTYFTKQVESEAQEEAGSSSNQEYLQLLKDKQDEEVWLGYTYMECKKREINLGLDLRGGVSVTLEISMSELVASMAGENATSPFFIKVAERTTELQKSEQESYVELFYQAYQEVGPAQPFVTWFISIDNEFTPQTTDDELLEKLTEYSTQALNQANEVLRSRVKQFGIAQPDIRKLGATGRIVVDLPGVKDLGRVRDLLQGSANLEFWDVYKWKDLQNEVVELASAYNLKYNELAVKDTTETDSTAAVAASEEVDSLSNEFSNLDEELEADGVDQFRNPFQDILYGGYDYSVPVAVEDKERVSEFLSSERMLKFLPRNSTIAWESTVQTNEQGSYIRFYLLKANRYGNPLMDGDIIKYARADYDMQNGGKVVYLDFKTSEVGTWEQITKKSFEDKKPIAIVLDGIVFSAPVASTVINSGSTVISGGSNDSQHWNTDLANVLSAGKFPAPAKIVEESFVGPSLGSQAISAGFMSFAIALLVVLLYMMYYYSTAGWVANVALIGNIFFIVGALAAAPTLSLTLPGLAGIVLTVGMSVDANVLIYERIREELRGGKGIKTAIADGYKKSYTAILDANITTLITGIILWYFGTGVIESFAQVLVIGILFSLFSAIFITRLIFNSLLEKDKKINFSTKMTENLFTNTSIKFIQNKNKFYIGSVIVIAVGIGSIFTNGFDLGTDFSGGRTYKVQFDNGVEEEDIKQALAAVFLDEKGNKLSPEVKTYGDETKIAITTKYLYNDQTRDAGVKVEQKLFEGLSEFFAAGTTFDDFSSQEDDKKVGLMQSYSVGPSIADDIVDSAYTSIIIALLAIFLYVAVRFRKVQFGVGALVAIFHDVLIVLSLFSIFWGVLPFSLEINQAFIAAILTVVGYSINDTVVVFDRIRETLPSRKTKPLDEVVNGALNSTLSRTFNTSITIVVVLLAILLFGGESIQGFAFALLVGVVVGTYSSLCIAAPVYVDLNKKKESQNV